MKPSVAIGGAVFGLALDRALKYIALTDTRAADGVFFGDGLLGFRLHINNVFAWSLPIPNSIALYLAVIVVLALIFVLFTKRAQPESAGLWLVLAGAASNIADRILYGGVVDYVSVPLGGAFNLADMLVILGVVIAVFPRRKYAH